MSNILPSLIASVSLLAAGASGLALALSIVPWQVGASALVTLGVLMLAAVLQIDDNGGN